MKNLTLLFLVFFTVLGVTQAQQHYIALQNRLANSDLVIEGKVIETKGFWNEARTEIYTSNLIQVHKVFKGMPVDEIEIITYGGTVEEMECDVSHGISFTEGIEGVFFCEEKQNLSSISKFSQTALRIHGGDAGFIQYYYDDLNPVAIDGTNVINDVEKELYPFLTNSPTSSYEIISPNTNEQRLSEWLSKNAIQLYTTEDDETVIEFLFENVVVAADLSKVDFDIYAKTNSKGIPFCEADIFLEYETAIFGSNIVSNNNIEIKKRNLLESSAYAITQEDDTNNTLRIEVTSDLSTPSLLSNIGAVKKQFCHISINIESIGGATGTISFNDFKMNGNVFYYDGSNEECISFDKVLVENPLEVLTTPIITDFFPDSLNAGVDDTLTIIGKNFGEIANKVNFRNANKGWVISDLRMETLPKDIVVWTDTLIRVLVPSKGTNNGVAGSGIVAVVNSDEEVGSLLTKTLNVGYAVLDRRFNAKGFRVNLVNFEASSDNSYQFYITQEMADSNVQACVEMAICDWNAQTEVDWKFDGIYTNTTPSVSDKKNVISWKTDMPDSILAWTLAVIPGTHNFCTSDTFFFSWDADIEFNANKDWHFDCSTPPDSGHYDFYGVLLHELGHAHLLDHAIPTEQPKREKVMYPSFDKGERRMLNNSDIAGGNNVIAHSIDQFPNGCSTTKTRRFNNPDCTTGTRDIDTSIDLFIYPNPFEDKVTIEFSLNESSEVKIQVFDVLGKAVYYKNKERLNSGSYSQLINLGNISSGIYFVQIETSNHSFGYKKIVKR